MTNKEFKKLLNKQQLRTFDLLQEAGKTGINTKDFRNSLFIQMPTTRVFEINRLADSLNIDLRIDGIRQPDGTKTYYLFSKLQNEPEYDFIDGVAYLRTEPIQEALL